MSSKPFAITGATCFLGSSRLGLQRRIHSLLSPRPGHQAEKSFLLKLAAPFLIFTLTLICAWIGVRRHTASLEDASVRLTAEAFPADSE